MQQHEELIVDLRGKKSIHHTSKQQVAVRWKICTMEPQENM